MKIVVTGGMGSGKSTAGRLLAESLGVGLLQSDALCRDLLQPGRSGWQGVHACWGERFLTANQEIDRPLLRQTIFDDAEVRLQLEQILHPQVRQIIRQRAAYEEAHQRNFLAEVPLLFEAGWADDFDWSVTVWAEDNLCAERIVRRDGVTREQAMAALRAQMPSRDKARAADSVLENSDTLETLREQVNQLARVLRQNPLFFS